MASPAQSGTRRIARPPWQNKALPDPSSVVMIGDREHDVFGAAEHGVETIGVLWGYGSREELATAGAKAIVETVDDLRDLLIRARSLST